MSDKTQEKSSNDEEKGDAVDDQDHDSDDEEHVPASPLHAAAKEGNVELLRTLISNNEDVSLQDDDGWTPLHEAAHSNNILCVQELIKHKDCDINCESNDGTALYLAVEYNSLALVKVLLKAGAHTSTPNSNKSLLHPAAMNPGVETLSFLLKEGLNTEITFNNLTPLQRAVLHKHRWSHVDLLLRHGARLDVTDKRNRNVIYLAVQTECVEGVELVLAEAKRRGELHLLDAQADDGDTAVFRASVEGLDDCLSVLVKYGPNVNIMTTRPFVSHPVCVALSTNMECVKTLLPLTDKSLFDQCTIHPVDVALTQAMNIADLMELLQEHDMDYYHVVDGDGPGWLTTYSAYEPWKFFQYFDEPYNYRNKNIPTSIHPRLLSKFQRYLDMGFIDPEYFTPLDSETVPPMLILLANGVLGYQDLLEGYCPLDSYYRDNFVGNLMILEAFELVTQYHRKKFTKIHKIGATRSLGVLLLSGVEVNTCFNVSEDDDYSLLSLARRHKKSHSLTVYNWLQVILSFCGFVNLSNTWANYMSAEEWTNIQQLQGEKQSLSSLCQRSIILDHLKTGQLSDIDDLPLPATVKHSIVNDRAYLSFPRHSGLD